MKAVVYRKYGTPDIMALQEVEVPVPKDNEVLVKVYAVGLNASDWEYLTGTPFYARIIGLFRPGKQILGSDVAGRVERVGKDVTRFRPGDEVFGDILEQLGGFAEYACAPEDRWLLKPEGLTFVEAAAIPQGGVIALQGLRDAGQVKPGDRVLINGAGGSAGSFAIQLAKHYGANVTAVDNGRKLDLMRSLGADRVLDYREVDYTQEGERYDMILDLMARRSVFAYRRALKPKGRFYMVGGSMATLLQVLLLGSLLSAVESRTIKVLVLRQNTDDIGAVSELIKDGTIKPVIDTCYPLEETPAALRHLGEGRALGKVVVTVESSSSQNADMS